MKKLINNKSNQTTVTEVEGGLNPPVPVDTMQQNSPKRSGVARRKLKIMMLHQVRMGAGDTTGTGTQSARPTTGTSISSQYS